VKIVKINVNDSGQRVDKFLSKYLPAMPKSLLYKQLRKKRVKRNGKALSAQDIIHAGDELYLYICDEFFTERKAPVGNFEGLSVVYEDDNILIADKPVGQKAHGGEDSLLSQIQSYLYQKGEYDPEKEHSFAPALSNRIDRNTCGLVLAAKNAHAQRVLNEKIKAGEIRKEYRCLVHGRFTESKGELENWLAISTTENRVHVVPEGTKGSVTAQLLYEVLHEQGERSLLHVTLLTGRKHQIRVQLAEAGHPLVGDTKYGAPRDAKYAYQALCAYKLTFAFTSPTEGFENLCGHSFESRFLL